MSGDRTLALINTAPVEIMGGKAVEPSSAVHPSKRGPAVQVESLAVNPRSPGVLRNLQAINDAHTVTTTTLCWTKLLTTRTAGPSVGGGAGRLWLEREAGLDASHIDPAAVLGTPAGGEIARSSAGRLGSGRRLGLAAAFQSRA